MLLCGVFQGSNLGPHLFLLYINDMPQALDYQLLLYADDTCLIFELKYITEIEMALSKDFSIICGWFVDNNISICFGEDERKSFLFGSRHEIKNSKPLNIQYNYIKTKQFSKVTYVGCVLDETLSGESLAFFYQQNRFLNVPLRKLLCNAIIQAFFNHACDAWYPNVKKKMKTRVQAAEK